jgi:hypothetical protein
MFLLARIRDEWPDVMFIGLVTTGHLPVGGSPHLAAVRRTRC